MAFDPDAHGLMSHYTPKAQQRIRRTILEDWQTTRVKLPTYMKLLARHIAPLDVPEEWLAKLSHQTMAKMLKFESTPRHTFWACLHLYIVRKHGTVVIDEMMQSASDLLGQAITQFGNVQPVSISGEIEVGKGQTMTITALETKRYARVSRVHDVLSSPNSEMQIQQKYEGVAFQTTTADAESKTVIILRDYLTQNVLVELYGVDQFKESKP
jgi:hypothetical protein